MPEFEAYLSYFSSMSTDQLIEWLSNAVPAVGLSQEALAFLQSFAQRILHEKQGREAAEQTA